MERSKSLALVLNYKPTSTYALNVVLGALETAVQAQSVEAILATNPQALASSIRDALRDHEKVLVGWSFYSPEFLQYSADLKLLKNEFSDPRVIHLAGGVHASAEPEQTLRSGFDLVAIGEGEKTVIDLTVRLVNDRNPLGTKGIAYLDADRYLSNGWGERIDLNDYPPYAPKHRRFNPIEITRGCIYACKFCQTPFMFKARFRHRSVENICHYVQVMKDHGLTDVRFISPTSLSYGSLDDSVGLDRLEELLASVRKVLGDKGRIFFGTFPSEVRPEHVTREALLILKKYVANNNLIIGGQSGSQRVLDLSHRGHAVEDIISAVRISLEVGFLPNVDFIFGLPGETASDIEASLKLAEQLSDMGARIHGHTFMPLPGTPFKNAPAGVIRPETLEKLKRLVSRGKLYGQWKQQVSIAQALAQIARPSRKYHEKKPGHAP